MNVGLPTAVLLAAVACAVPLNAQQPQRAVLLPQLPASVRAAALGNAFVLGSGEPEAIFYNPALSGGMEQVSVSGQWYGGSATLYTVAAGGQILGTSLAVGLQTVDYGAAPGDLGFADLHGAERLTVAATRVASERVLTVGANRRMLGVRLGVAVKALERREDAERRVRPAVDLSTGLNVGPVAVGLSVHDLGESMTLGEEEVDLPTRATLGASSRTLQLGPLDVVATAAATYHFDEEFVSGGGVEVSYWPIQGRTFTARAGWREMEEAGAEPLTLGAAVTLDSFMVEYAWQRFEQADVHRVGVRLR